MQWNVHKCVAESVVIVFSRKFNNGKKSYIYFMEYRVNFISQTTWAAARTSKNISKYTIFGESMVLVLYMKSGVTP